MFNLFRKSPSDAGRILSRERKRQERDRIRAVCDEMRARHGLEPVDWSKL